MAHQFDDKTEEGSEKVGLDIGQGGNEGYGETQRGLKPRHVQLMAIGGSIGVGMWVGIGSVLMRAGPVCLVSEQLFPSTDEDEALADTHS